MLCDELVQIFGYVVIGLAPWTPYAHCYIICLEPYRCFAIFLSLLYLVKTNRDINSSTTTSNSIAISFVHTNLSDSRIQVLVLEFLQLSATMSNGLWPKPFVGTHIRLWDHAPTDGASWDLIPYEWHFIRFDAIDVLFISPFHVEDKTHAFILGRDEHGTYMKRFTWVIQSARTKNPLVKIIVVQMMDRTFEGGDFRNLPADQNSINSYATSVAAFLETWYNHKLSSLDGTYKVDARLNGWEVDVEGGTDVEHLPTILSAVRHSLDALSVKLQAPKFTVSICPAWADNLDATVADSVNYVNMQRYSGGAGTTAASYKGKVPKLADSQLIWGLCSEEPYRNAPETKDFDGMKKKVQDVVAGHEPGIWTWKVNSDNFLWANDFQVWLYNQVHPKTSKTPLPNSKSEDMVARYYEGGGRLSWKWDFSNKFGKMPEPGP